MATTIQNPKSKTQNASKVASVFGEAERFLVGGVNSPVRAFRQIGCAPLMLVKGRGATVIDSTGRRYIDFIGGWGALMLGHSHPAVVSAVRRALAQDLMTGLTHPSEIELARLIAAAVASVEQVRFTVSGTEACMTAIKLARAHTKRAKVLMFDGCYHGHAPAGDVITVPFNDTAAAQEVVRRAADELACLIVEPVAANMGVVNQEP